MAAMELQITSLSELAERLCARLLQEVEASLKDRGACSLALTGGSVGAQLYPLLLRIEKASERSKQDQADWSQLHIFWGDERAVPRLDPLSNYKQAHDLWLSRSCIPAGNIHPMDPVSGELEAGARKYEALLRSEPASSSGLDIVLLGVGSDGHVCSLFPEHPLLSESATWVGSLSDSPKPPAERLTLTLPALTAARLVIVTASGQAKAEAIRQAQESDKVSPLAQVLRRAKRSLLFLDEAAAG